MTSVFEIEIPASFFEKYSETYPLQIQCLKEMNVKKVVLPIAYERIYGHEPNIASIFIYGRGGSYTGSDFICGEERDVIIHKGTIQEIEGIDFDDIETSDGPEDDNNDNEPLNNGRSPIFPTDEDFLPPNILTDPGNLNKQLNERLQQKKFSEYAKAGNIDVPYLIGVDNVNRLYNNNKMQAELRNGTANNKDRIKQWHRDKTLYKLDKYGLYKQPIQIKHPFNK